MVSQNLKLPANFIRLAGVIALSLCAVTPCFGQDNPPRISFAEPQGPYVQLGPSTLRGAGVQIGYVNANDFYTGEFSILVDLLPALKPDLGNLQIAFTLGGAVRLLGFERTIGNVPYRGFDIDLGFRAGPGFSYSDKETRATKNKRFNLFLEPYLRYSRRIGGRQIYYLELGTIRPHLRFGVWLMV